MGEKDELNNLLSYICCPSCKGDLKIRDNKLFCSKGNEEFLCIDNIPILLPALSNDLKLTQRSWNKIYSKDFSYYEQLKREVRVKKHLSQIIDHIESFLDYQQNNIVYLEIGCGPMIVGQEIAKKVNLIVGIDISFQSLKIAKEMLDSAGIKNYLLVCGEITQMPFKEGLFNFVYGGGVIEHFKDTLKVIKEMYRILKRGGVVFNSVPYLNLGSIYRQIWGNIPNLPILKQIAELIHIKLLKSKYMTFGYEYSFTKKSLIKLHQQAGFEAKYISSDKLNVCPSFDYIKNKKLKKIATYLAINCRQFWPMIYVAAKKSE